MKVYKYDPENETMIEVDIEEFLNEIKIHYALTYNINEYEYINKKRWRDYTHKKQEGILMRKVRSFCNGTNAVIEQIRFETCPKTKQRHVHAYIYKNEEIKERYVELMNNKYRAHGYRTIDCNKVRNEEAWLRYIKKDQDK